jgi:hypothetical protein
MSKPHISILWSALGLWRCEGSGWTITGTSPKQAYDLWYEHVNAI